MNPAQTPVPADLPDTVTPEPAAAPVGPRRSGRGWRDMARSLVVLLIPVAIFVAIFRFQGGEDVVVIDAKPVYADARGAGAFPVLEPTGLPDGWRAVRAAYQREADGAVLRVGYLSPDDGQTQLVQSNRPAEALVKQELGENGIPRGTVHEAGRVWQVYAVRDGELALVSVAPDRTVIVVGATDVATLRTLAGALR